MLMDIGYLWKIMLVEPTNRMPKITEQKKSLWKTNLNSEPNKKPNILASKATSPSAPTT